MQMFRNDAFSFMIKSRLNEVGPQFIRALCRCSSSRETGFEVSWNPTVRKMTFLVLTELEGHYKQLDTIDTQPDAFSIACEEAVSGTTSQMASSISSDVMALPFWEWYGEHLAQLLILPISEA